MITQGVLVVNFGSQFTQLIARRIRESGVYTEVCQPDETLPIITSTKPKGIVFSGGPYSIYSKSAPKIDKQIFDCDIPILGVCYGMQLIAHSFGAKVSKGKVGEYGHSNICLQKNESALFRDTPQKFAALLSHADEVNKCPKSFCVLARSSPNQVIAAIAHSSKPIFGVQFHPEATQNPEGKKILDNFLFHVCGCKKTWKIGKFLERSLAEIRQTVGNENVILGLSGGIDSSVTALMVHQAIGKKLTCIFIDTGLLRYQEAQKVLRIYKQKKFDLNIQFVPAGHIFLDALHNVSDPEQKRKIIGRLFIEIFEKEAHKIKNARFLAQGTIYPDVIESGMRGQLIKSHHNVGGLPKKMRLKVIEPLRLLFKDEVKKLGKTLDMPVEILEKHPFPGPGLGVRILGPITRERIATLQQADEIFMEELRKHKLYERVGQAFAVLLPIKSVGVMGDKRSYENTCALRCVDTTDFMTATPTRLPHELLEKVSARIIGEVSGINRVVYDISSKPPTTIEWE